MTGSYKLNGRNDHRAAGFGMTTHHYHTCRLRTFHGTIRQMFPVTAEVTQTPLEERTEKQVKVWKLSHLLVSWELELVTLFVFIGRYSLYTPAPQPGISY